MLAAVALLPLAPRLRIACAVLAAGMAFVVLALQLRTVGARRRNAASERTYARIERIRRQRERRR